jgi:fido (protein-threonine AMPylation protein)
MKDKKPKPKKEKKVIMKPYSKGDVTRFLMESSAIESQYGKIAQEDSEKAWAFAFKGKGKMDVDWVLGIHKLLMQRIYPEIAGKLRNCDVWIGGKRKIFINHALLEAQLKEWLDGCNPSDLVGLPPIERDRRIVQWHVAFEAIHPEIDGNGRLGRILMNIHRWLAGLPIQLILEEEKWAYYSWFQDPSSVTW